MGTQVLLLLVLSGTANALYKRWLPNTDFGNSKNWNSGRLPCGNDIVLIQEESPSIFLQVNTTLSELRLPKTAEIVLGSDSTLAFTNNPDHSAGCLSSGSEIEFNATYPSDWLDPKNWCTSNTESGGCITMPRLDSEMVPCSYDDVVFQKGHSYYVNVDTGFDLTINTLKITGKSYTTNTFSTFLNTNDGKLMFPVPRTGSRSTINIRRRSCNDPSGCACGNGNKKILKHICNIQSPHCKLAQCSSSLQPKGGCCNICGGVLTASYASGFRYNTLRDGLKRNFLDGKDDYKDVVFTMSKTSDNKIQIVLSDDKGTQSSQIANMMKKALDDDISAGGFKYGVTEVNLETSEGATKPVNPAAQTGGQESLPGGEIAGIAVGLSVVLLVGLILAFFVYRRKTRSPDELGFKVFDKVNFNFNLKRKLRKPRVEVPPSFGFRFGGPGPENIGTQGFDNPMYGSNPLDNEKPLDLEMMPTAAIDPQKQPTFDKDLGFDNPLYDNTLQESLFSDPTSINDDTKAGATDSKSQSKPKDMDA